MKESSKMGVVSGLLILLVPWSVIQDHFWFVNFKRQTTWFGQNYFDVCSDTVSLWLMWFVILSFSSLDELGNCVSHWLMIREWLNRQTDSWITAGVQKVSMLSDNHCRCAKGIHVVGQTLQVCRKCPCCLIITADVWTVAMLSEDSSLTISQGLTIAPTFCVAAPLCRCWMATYSAKARGELLLHVAPHHPQTTWSWYMDILCACTSHLIMIIGGISG